MYTMAGLLGKLLACLGLLPIFHNLAGGRRMTCALRHLFARAIAAAQPFKHPRPPVSGALILRSSSAACWRTLYICLSVLRLRCPTIRQKLFQDSRAIRIMQGQNRTKTTKELITLRRLVNNPAPPHHFCVEVIWPGARYAHHP